MNPEEQIAYNFLVKQGFTDIVFEPQGDSLPPDFSAGDHIGIEVRRLNKQVEVNGKVEPIEKAQFSFIPYFESVLKEMDEPDNPFSFALSVRYKRPLKGNKVLKDQLKKIIKVNILNENYYSDIEINEKLVIAIYPCKTRLDTTYFIGSRMDFDQGGAVQPARFQALKLSIAEKDAKCSHLHNIYKELWLILVDTIFSRVDQTYLQDLAWIPEIQSSFSRIIVISKLISDSWVDLYPWPRLEDFR